MSTPTSGCSGDTRLWRAFLPLGVGVPPPARVGGLLSKIIDESYNLIDMIDLNYWPWQPSLAVYGGCSQIQDESKVAIVKGQPTAEVALKEGSDFDA